MLDVQLLGVGISLLDSPPQPATPPMDTNNAPSTASRRARLLSCRTVARARAGLRSLSSFISNDVPNLFLVRTHRGALRHESLPRTRQPRQGFHRTRAASPVHACRRPSNSCDRCLLEDMYLDQASNLSLWCTGPQGWRAPLPAPRLPRARRRAGRCRPPGTAAASSLYRCNRVPGRWLLARGYQPSLASFAQPAHTPSTAK